MNFTNNLEKAEKFENLKNKILKYILYKKRTENEIRKKFSCEDENMLEDAIEYFKEQNYINDSIYVERAITEYIALRNLSIKEISYKIIQKGVSKAVVDEYISKNKEKMLEYEISSAKSIIMKKQSNVDEQNIKNYLFQKGYMSETIEIAFDSINEE